MFFEYIENGSFKNGGLGYLYDKKVDLKNK